MVIFRLAGSALLALLAFSLGASNPAREVAITFDDLPGHPSHARKLLHAITSAKVPAIGFVNEDKLRTPAHTATLERWLDAGLELGNHTYAHIDLHRVPVEAFERDIARGDEVTRRLMQQRGRVPRWFRHPFLHSGRSLETRDRVHRFLAARGYRVAPVTLDNSEWIFASAYQKTNDAALRKRIGLEYVAYMDRKLAYYELQSQETFGRNIRHVLLLHDNALNADWFGALAASMRKRGYRFIPLERALEDPAYRSADTWTGAGGISWLHRWTIAANKKVLPKEPTTARWVLDAAGLESE